MTEKGKAIWSSLIIGICGGLLFDCGLPVSGIVLLAFSVLGFVSVAMVKE